VKYISISILILVVIGLAMGCSKGTEPMVEPSAGVTSKVVVSDDVVIQGNQNGLTGDINFPSDLPVTIFSTTLPNGIVANVSYVQMHTDTAYVGYHYNTTEGVLVQRLLKVTVPFSGMVLCDANGLPLSGFAAAVASEKTTLKIWSSKTSVKLTTVSSTTATALAKGGIAEATETVVADCDKETAIVRLNSIFEDQDLAIAVYLMDDPAFEECFVEQIGDQVVPVNVDPGKACNDVQQLATWICEIVSVLPNGQGELVCHYVQDMANLVCKLLGVEMS